MNGTTAGITPVPCHSHNDYWRKAPLFDALQAGCTSIEADIWLANDDEGGQGDLYVGHSKRSLSKKRTLQSLYIKPLTELLANR
jgi:hypothetical protein